MVRAGYACLTHPPPYPVSARRRRRRRRLEEETRREARGKHFLKAFQVRLQQGRLRVVLHSNRCLPSQCTPHNHLLADFCRCLEGWYAEGLNPVFTLALTTARAKPLSLQEWALESPSPSCDSSPRMACDDPMVRFRENCPPHLHPFVPPRSANAFS